MRRRAAWLLLLPLLLGGCGDRSLILTVDVLSFLSPSDVSQSYSIPGGLSADTLDVASESVNLLPGVEDVTDLFTATPIASLPFSLTPGNVTNVSTEVSSTALAQAMVHESARVGVRVT